VTPQMPNNLICILVLLPLCVGCTKKRDTPPTFHVISADPCDLQAVGTVGNIKYFLKTNESYVIDAKGNKRLTFLTKQEYDEQFKKWVANQTPENLPASSVCAGLPMSATGTDVSATVDSARGEIVITTPSGDASSTTTTYIIEHEEEVTAK
jgi:hypothetical protein